MPRRRTTRNKTKRPGPAMPAGDEGSSIDAERRKEKVKALIQDFENEVQSRLHDVEVMKKDWIKQIDLAYTVELMQMPPEIRSMKLTDYLSKGGTFEVKKSSLSSEADSIVSSICGNTNDGSSAATNQLQAVEEDENMPTTTTRKGRPRRKKAEASAAPPPTVRRGRSRQTGDLAMQTPANATRPSSSMMTPLITPKFDMRLYQSGAAVTRRQAKQDEMLVSVDGSPVMSFNEPAKVLLVNKSQRCFRDVSELSNLDSSTLMEAVRRLDQMKEQISAVVNSKNPTGK